MLPPPDMDAVAQAFLSFAEKECSGQSPLYAALSRRIAGDGGILRLADQARTGQPRPNMLFAAVHALLRSDPFGSELAAFYLDLHEPARDPAAAFEPFKTFCRARSEAITELLRRRVVNTNEVLRAAFLRPAYAQAEQALGRFHLLEIGASAGLTLIWDRYAYADSDAPTCDAAAPALLLTTEARGPNRPPGPPSPPLSRCGIDPEPLAVDNPEDRAWLQALVWPEQTARSRRLAAALEIAAADPPRIVRGTAGECLPGLLRALPVGAPVCVSHAFTLNQFSHGDRKAFEALLLTTAESRPLARVGLEWGNAHAPELHLTLYGAGQADSRRLAYCDPHGAWLSWGAC